MLDYPTHLILTIKDCDDQILKKEKEKKELKLKIRRMALQLGTVKKAPEDLQKEAGQLDSLLVELEKTIVKLPDGPVKDEHLKKRDAMVLRKTALKTRLDKFSPVKSLPTRLKLDYTERFVLETERCLSLLMARREELVNEVHC